MNLNKFKGYTPGPWGISRHFATLIEASGGRGICSAGGYSDSHNADRVYAENHANAALIAAAPSLLEYARKLESALREIANADPVELALDPQSSRRLARKALESTQ